MPSLIKYSLFLLADIAIIGFIVHFGYSTLTLRGSIALEEFEARGRWSGSKRIDELKVNAYYVAAITGFGLALYGALHFLFSWMPYDWVSYSEDSDPMWAAKSLAGTGALFGAFALPIFLTKTKAELLELHRSKLREAEAKAFDGLIERELT